MSSYKELIEGRALLKRLLPKMRKELRLNEPGAEVQAMNMLAQSNLTHIRVENFDALVIHNNGSGWVADLVFKKLPAGVPNTMGTPEAYPHKSRRDALEEGKMLLANFLRVAIENEAASRDGTDTSDLRFFDLFGRNFPFPSAAIDGILKAMSMVPEEVFGTRDIVIDRLRMNLKKIMGHDGFDDALWDRAPHKDKLTVFANMATLIALGEFRYHPGKTLSEETRKEMEKAREAIRRQREKRPQSGAGEEDFDMGDLMKSFSTDVPTQGPN